MNPEALCAEIVMRAIEDYENAVVKRDDDEAKERIRAIYMMADIEQFVNSSYCGHLSNIEPDALMAVLKSKLKTSKSDIAARKFRGCRSIYA